MTPKNSRPGFTLIELLIVVAILITIAAFLIPAVKPTLEDRKIREAARMLNVFFAGAQARAIERGRPVGVWLERNPNSNNECIQIFLAEAPLPYAGDVVGARAFTSMVVDGMGNPLPNPVTGNIPYFQATFFGGLSPSVNSLIVAGDTIKFDYRGPTYLITAPPTLDASSNPVVYFDMNNGRAPTVGFAFSYQIFRQPSRGSATTFALPSKTSINLYYSGMTAGGFGLPGTGGGGATSATDISPILITFSPSGKLDRVYFQGTGTYATDSVYLFVNRNDKVLPNQSRNVTGIENLEDLNNLWVTVGHRTGAILTVENANTQGAPLNAAKLVAARSFAREKTSSGGQ